VIEPFSGNRENTHSFAENIARSFYSSLPLDKKKVKILFAFVRIHPDWILRLD